MSFLTPLGFALSALAIPIILLYMLKLRRKQVEVSSTYLWQKLLREQQANAPWQKLKRNLLLILQLIILAALVIAYARPAIQVPTVASGAVIVLLDASASMNATDVPSTRFDEAKRAVASLIDGMTSASSMTLILVARSPQTLISSETDPTALKEALSKATISPSPADWNAAFALAAGASRSENATIVIVSDGGLPQEGLPALPAEVRYIPIGKTNDNIAITALALRSSKGIPQLFAQATNYSDADRKVVLSIYLGDQLYDARQLDIQAHSSASVTLDNLPTATGIYKAQIASPNTRTVDALPLDDIAFAVYQSASARRVLLVSNGNLFLEQLLASLPGIQPFKALPKADGTLQIPNEPFDLYIFDGYVPKDLPNGNLLFINPTSNSLFEVGAPFKDIKDAQVREHNLTRFVDWSNVHVLQASAVVLPSWADMLIGTETNPLVFAGETDGRRVAALTFDLRQSDLPLQIAYPILFSNLINYLSPPNAIDSSQSLHVGESLSIVPQTDVQQVVIASPSGKLFTLAPNQILFTKTDELGYYAVNFISKDSNKAEYFAVNLFDENESNIAPRQTLQIGRVVVSPVEKQKIGQRELWQWLILLALLVLLIEWQAYHRKNIFHVIARRVE